MHLPDNIQKIRKLTQLTQEDFAKYAEKETGLEITLFKQKAYENGRTEPDTPYLEWLSKLSNTPIKEIRESELMHETLKLHVQKVQFEKQKKPKQDFSNDPSEHSTNLVTFEKGELLDLFKQMVIFATEKVVEADKRTEKALKDHNEYLQGLVNTNLNVIEKWSFATLVDVQANVRYQAEKEADGNEAQVNKILAKQGKIAGVIRGRLKPEGNLTTQGKKSKD